MEVTGKLHPGQQFSPEMFKCLDGADHTFGMPEQWQALFVFRGQHYPICKAYLAKLEANREAFVTLGVEITAVSADDEAQTRLMAVASNPKFPLLYGMDVEAMKRLGLYISEPRSLQETYHPFAEPALLVVNPEGVLQIVAIANAPFLRPEIDRVLGGLSHVIGSNYPVRGTRR